MDKRTMRTKNAIEKSFIGLRTIKPIEKITVTELVLAAQINKATFYRYYNDIYDLSDEIEDKLIRECIYARKDISDTFNEKGLADFLYEFKLRKGMLDIVFSGSREAHAIPLVHKYISERIFEKFPQLRNDKKEQIALTTWIYGTFYALKKYYKIMDEDEIVSNIAKIIQQVIMTFPKKASLM